MGTPILRQIIVIGSLSWISMSFGLIYGQLTGVLKSLKENDEHLNFGDKEISIIATTCTTITIVGMGIVAIVTDRVGKRVSFMIFAIPMLVNWILLYYAKNIPMFVLARVSAGISLGALMALYTCTTSEYTSPKIRGLFLNFITTVAPAVGTCLGHYLVLIYHWRKVALIGVVFSIISVLLPCLWVESPHWLATQGRFEECKESFTKLHESTAESERELEILIKIEKNKLNKAKETNTTSLSKRLRVALKRRYFWDLMLLTSVLYMYIAASGKLIFSTLATFMLENMTGTSDVLLFTLSVDGSLILGAVLSCVLIKRISMRNLLFSTGFFANILLVTLSGCLYFKSDKPYFQWINVFLLASYFILINAGPFPVITAIAGEIFPSDIKLFCFFISATVLIIFLSLSLILFPGIISLVDYPGLFLLNAIIMSASLAFAWMKLPETKGKTLQEIEVYFKTNEFNIDKALESEQMNALI